MAPTIWGMLKKSQADNETIEQAIDRIVAAHNEDPESHLGEGQALQSHKASAIIDHRALSIVTDKLEPKSVTVEKLNWNRFLIQSSFESLDAFVKTITGASSSASVNLGELKMRVGPTTGNKVIVSGELDHTNVTNEKSPFMQVAVHWPDDSSAKCDWGIGFACKDPFSTPYGSFGFLWDDTTNALYTFYQDSCTYYYEVPNPPRGRTAIYSMELIHNPAGEANKKDSLYFYIDGVLVKSYVGVRCNSDTQLLFGLSIYNSKGNNVDSWNIYFSNLIIGMDYDS